jgi:hypothetical protein
MRIVLCLLIVAALGGCACAVPNAAPAAVGAAPCASCAAAPVAAPVPVAAVPVGVQYRVGAAEYTRAALSVPGSLVGCGATAVGEAGQVLARFLKCAAESLVPTPTPSAYMVPLAPAAAVPAAAPCAPAAPAGRWVWQPSVSEALPAPPAGAVCVNGSCGVAAR